VLAVIGFALMTSITLRAVHAGLAAMLTGARRLSRPIWIGGACLVGLVIVKLILIDRTHLKDLHAILGVLAVGGLLMIVGYFAPNPPKPVEAEL
jgi:uncharacterized membrane protein